MAEQKSRREFLKNLGLASTLVGPGRFIFRAGSLAGFFLGEEALAQYAPFGFIKKRIVGPVPPPLPTYSPGAMFSWGDNAYLQLGTNTSGAARSSPIQTGSATTWKEVSAGDDYTMAVRSDGTLWGWGDGDLGKIGKGNQTLQSSPTQVGNHTTWKRVFAGLNTTAAVKTDGTLWLWGSNDKGQLGNGTNNNRSSPVQLGTDTNWVYASLGGTYSVNHIVALKSNGTLWAWGDNSQNQLGIAYNRPVAIGTATNWKQVRASQSNTIAIKTDGTLWAWGNNSAGTLGNGSTTNITTPTKIGLLTNWAWVDMCGTYSSTGHTAAVKTDGTLWTWGNNDRNQLGHSGTTPRSSPVQVGSATDWSKAWVQTDIFDGSITLALKTDGSLWTYGFHAAHLIGVAYNTPTMVGSSGWMSLATGDSHTAGVQTDGTLWTWGGNNYGQLGLGTNQTYYAPTKVGAVTTWDRVAAAANRTYAIRSDGSLWAWGENTNGVLGDGTTFTRSAPVQIGALTNWSQISAGYYHTAATKTDGTIWTWGLGSDGRLGHGNTSNLNSPVQVGAATNWTHVSAGGGHTLAIRSGALWGWGANSLNQLGLGSGDSNAKSSPVQIGAATNWTNISAGQDTTSSGIRAPGSLWTWGYAFNGNLGQGSSGWLQSPVQLGALTTWSNIYMGRRTTMAVQTDGSLWAWGSGTYGTIGDGANTDRSSPVIVSSGEIWAGASASYQHAAGIRQDGTIYTWGDHQYGQLGLFGISRQVTGSWKQVSIGTYHAIGIRSDDSIYEWGQYRTTTNNVERAPKKIGSASWLDASVGVNHVLAVQSNNSLWAWGANSDGVLGRGNTTDSVSPIQIGSLTNWVKVAANNTYSGASNSAAIKTDGTLWAWGKNQYGQIGNGTEVDRNSPVQIGTATNWQSISLGGDSFINGPHSMGVQTDGTLWAWGSNNTLQLGVDHRIPLQVGSGTTWAMIAVGSAHSLGLKSDGTLWGWGYNGYYAVGNGSSTNVKEPVQIGVATDWVYINTGSAQSFAIKSNGTLWAWGNNANGQLGDGTTTTRSVPTQIGTLGGWKAVQCGRFGWSSGDAGATIALRSDGTIWTWGWGYYGQLGTGSSTDVSSPVQVGSLTTWTNIAVGKTHTHGVKP